MKDIFIETQNVAAFRSAVANMEDAMDGLPGIALAWGQAGRGKTFAAENYYALNGGVYLRVWQDWSQCAFLQALCFELAGARPRSANACKLRIVEALDKEARTIFVDEADRLHVRRLEDLRDIHVATGAPVVLIGEEELTGLLAERRRIWSRVTHEVYFGPVNEDDIATFALNSADLDVDPAACNLIAKKTEGDFRLVRNMVKMLEQAAKARQTSDVDPNMVQDVLRQRSWRRG